jgi:polar amino acid transport system substrate-binding protein
MNRKKLGPFEIVLIVALALAIICLCCLGLYLVLGPIFNQNGNQPVPVETTTPQPQPGMCLMDGRLLVGTSADYPPFETYTEGFTLDGFDIALMKEVAARMDLPLEFRDIAFEGLGGALQLNQINAAISAISVTSERAEEFTFSNVYYVGAGGILAPVNSNQAPITSPDQLVDKRLGVQNGTVYQSWAQANLVDAGKMPAGNLYSYPRIDQAINDLITNKIDLVLLDQGPARNFANQGSAKLVAEGFNQQGYAIGLRPDCAALRDQINAALAQIQNDGTLASLTKKYLDLGTDEIIPLPTAVPPTATPPVAVTATARPTAGPTPTPTITPGCIDGMTFVRDLTYPDNNMSSPPVIQPGTPFQKGWRIRNSGTCTWNYQYYLAYAGGNSKYSSMGGQPTAIVGSVSPGATYDLYVNLVAPAVPGVYQGFWQMTNPRGVAFGERIWVGIQVPPVNPATPTPAPNIPQIYRFLVNPTVIQLGQCVQISWETSGDVSAVNIFRNGSPIWVNGPAIGTLQDCPQQSGQIMYEIQANGPGGTARSDQPVTVVESPPPTDTPAPQPPPVISSFQVQPGQIDLGGCVNINWTIQGTVDYVRLARNGQIILDNAANVDSASDCPPQPGSTVYRLEASGAGQTVSDERTISVNDIPQPPALAGTSWVLTDLSDGQGGMQPVIAGTQITLAFNGSGAIQGVSGCNNYTGSYLADGNAISLMVDSTTQMTCADPAGVMEQESLYLSLLQSSSGFNLNGSQLKLYGGMNSPQLVFVSILR